MRRWFVLSAMRNSRSISKLTGRNISPDFGGRSFLISKACCDSGFHLMAGCDSSFGWNDSY